MRVDLKVLERNFINAFWGFRQVLSARIRKCSARICFYFASSGLKLFSLIGAGSGKHAMAFSWRLISPASIKNPTRVQGIGLSKCFPLKTFKGRRRTAKEQDNFIRKLFIGILQLELPDASQMPTRYQPSAPPNAHRQQPPYMSVKSARFRKFSAR